MAESHFGCYRQLPERRLPRREESVTPTCQGVILSHPLSGYFHSQVLPVVLSLASVSYSNTATVPASFANFPLAVRK